MESRLVRISALAIVLGALAGCSTATVAPTSRPVDEPLAATEALCPVMWDWVEDVGDAFNRAASDVASIEAAPDRRSRWMDSLDEIEKLNQQLLTDLAAIDDRVAALLIAEVEHDMPLATAQLDDMRQLITDTPEIDEERHQTRTAQIIVLIEKVIDLPKPDLGANDPDGLLLPAFRRVPSCQHAVRDVDDVVPRANG